MFTGLIEEIGTVRTVSPVPDGKNFEIRAQQIFEEMRVDASIAVSGVCLTVTQFSAETFQVTAIGETLTKTTLNHLRPGQPVNLERAMRADTRLGGHLVQGHVDGIGTVETIEQRGVAHHLFIRMDESVAILCIPGGSVAIDGISLTIADRVHSTIEIAIIPHTWTHTAIHRLTEGVQVNIETDIIGKYVARFLEPYGQKQEGLTFERLKALGY